MRKRKEIKFRDNLGILVGRQNGMRYQIMRSPGVPDCEPAYLVIIVNTDSYSRVLDTGDHQLFTLEGAKEFCERVAHGEIDLEELRRQYQAQDDLEERRRFKVGIERAKAVQAALEAVGLSSRDLMRLWQMWDSLGEDGRSVLRAYEQGEGWPEC